MSYHLLLCIWYLRRDVLLIYLPASIMSILKFNFPLRPPGIIFLIWRQHSDKCMLSKGSESALEQLSIIYIITIEQVAKNFSPSHKCRNNSATNCSLCFLKWILQNSPNVMNFVGKQMSGSWNLSSNLLKSEGALVQIFLSKHSLSNQTKLAYSM